MHGAVDEHQFLFSGRGGIISQRHDGGNKMIVFAVEKEEGEFRFSQSFLGMEALEIKAAAADKMTAVNADDLFFTPAQLLSEITPRTEEGNSFSAEASITAEAPMDIPQRYSGSSRNSFASFWAQRTQSSFSITP